MDSSNRNRFDHLFISYHPRLVAYVRRFVDSNELAEDLVQDVFVKYWMKYSSLPVNEPSCMLFTMARNSCLNYIKHKRVLDLRMSLVGLEEVGEEKLYNLDFNFSTADKDLMLNEIRSEINAVMDSLPNRCRQVFEMSRFQGMKNHEIAVALGVSVSTVEKHMHRALKAFEDSLTDSSTDIYKVFILLIGI